MLDFLKTLAGKFNSQWVLLLVLIAVNAIVHWRILAPEVISYGDFDYFYSENLDNIGEVTPWQDSVNYGGQVFAPFREPLEQGFDLFGTDKHVSEKFLIIYPTLIIASIAPFLLVYEFTRRKLAGITAFIVFNFNSYFLVSSEHFLLYSAAAFATLGLYLYTISFRVKKQGISEKEAVARSRLALFGSILPFWIASVYDFRMAYIAYVVTALIGVLMLVTPSYRRRLITIRSYLISQAVFWLSTLLINLYWLWTVFSGAATSTAATGRQLFGDQFWGLDHAIALHHPFWQFGPIEWFVDGPVPLVFWIIPAAALASLLFRSNRFIAVMVVVGLLGIFLTKQSDAPFGFLYARLYDTIPGFDAYREATKFYYLIVLSYSVLISITVMGITKLRLKRRGNAIKSSLIAICMLPFVVSIVPIVTGSHGSIYQQRAINADYQALKTHIESSPDSYRTLWAPSHSIWTFNTSKHPAISLASLLNTELSDLGLASASGSFDFFGENFADYVLDYSSVKYVIVPIDDVENSDTAFTFFPNSRDEYIAQLDAASYLQRVNLPGIETLAVYENANYQPRLAAYSSVRTAAIDAQFGELYDLWQQNSSLYLAAIGNQGDQVDVQSLSLGQGSEPIVIEPGTYSIVKQDSADIWVSSTDTVVQFEAEFAETPDYLADLGIQSKETQVLYSTSLDSFDGYAIELNDSAILPLNSNSRERIAGIDEITSLALVQLGSNLVENGDFSDGLWNEEIQNCNNYDDNPLINQQLFSFEQPNFITLTATRHSACAFTDISNTSGQLGRLVFDARTYENSQGAVAVIADGEVVTRIEIENSSDDWQTIASSIVLPEGTETIQLYLYSDENEDRQTQSEVDYRNVSFSTIEFSADIMPELQNLNRSSQQVITIDEALVIAPPPTDVSQNIVPNGDFEQGLWRESVDNCFNYDDNPILDMTLQDGALVLEAERHFACTIQTVTVPESGTYALQFDFDASQAQNAGAAITYISQNEQVTRFDVNLDNEQAGTFSDTFVVPPGVSEVDVFLYSRENSDGSRNIVSYDNVVITRVADVPPAFIYPEDTNASTFQDATHAFVGNGLQRASVNTTADSFVLVANALFDESWTLQGTNSLTQVDESSQRAINTVFNAWDVTVRNSDTQSEEVQNYTFELSYGAVGMYKSLYVFSMAVLMGLLGYFVYLAISLKRGYE